MRSVTFAVAVLAVSAVLVSSAARTTTSPTILIRGVPSIAATQAAPRITFPDHRAMPCDGERHRRIVRTNQFYNPRQASAHTRKKQQTSLH